MGRLLKSRYAPLLWLIAAWLTGALTAKVPKLAFLIGLGALGWGLWSTLIRRNRYGEAHLYAGFIVGAEVYFRMAHAGLPWEFGKIATFLLLGLGWLVRPFGKPTPLIFLFYLLLLLPGVFVPDWNSIEAFKKEFMFTFFGEVVLVVAMLYFYKRKMEVEELLGLMRLMLLGVVMTSGMLFMKVPDYAAIHYGGGSNFVASGGFGPNQVSAILGLGIVLIGYSLLTGRKLFVWRWLDLVLLTIFALQGLFTLSRGGLMAAALALAVAVLAIYLNNPRQAVRLLSINPGKVVLLVVLMVFAYNLANDVSRGAIERRYFNVDQYGRQIKEDYTTKRGDIVKDDWQTFLDDFITGAGIGGGRAKREQSTGISAAHVELSRLPAEHGILGLIALLIMLFYPVWTFFKVQNTLTRFTLALFTAYAVLTMTHNAMRLAMPSFLYGAGFIWIMLQSRSTKLTDRE